MNETVEYQSRSNWNKNGIEMRSKFFYSLSDGWRVEFTASKWLMTKQLPDHKRG
jgi:hypothetical protein